MTNDEQKKMRFDLEERLIDFMIIRIADNMVDT